MTGDARHYGNTFDFKPETWMDSAACIGYDPAIWFPEGESGDADKTRVAKSICEGCPVRIQCLDYSLRSQPGRTHHGIWGGLSAETRRLLSEEAS